MINFKVSLFERDIIVRIIDRFITWQNNTNSNHDKVDRLTAEMDLTACHCNGKPLRLDVLLNSPTYDFLADLFGIFNNIDRETGKVDTHFTPKCILPPDSFINNNPRNGAQYDKLI